MLNVSPVALLVAAGCFLFFRVPTLSALPTRNDALAENKNKSSSIKLVYKRKEFREMELEEGRIPAWVGEDGLMRVPSAFASASFELDDIRDQRGSFLREFIDRHYGVVVVPPNGISDSSSSERSPEEDPFVWLREFVPSLRQEGAVGTRRMKPNSTNSEDERISDECTTCYADNLSPSVTYPDGSDLFVYDFYSLEYLDEFDDTNVPVPSGCSFENDPPGYLICNDRSMTSVPSDLPRQIPLSIFEMNNTNVEVLSRGDFYLLDVLEMKLDGNLIETVEPGAFDNITNIGSLSMKHNSILSLDWQVFEGLDTLVVLSLRDNRINLTEQFKEPPEKMPLLPLPFLPQLSYLDLAENPLGALNEFVFAYLANSTVVELNLKSCSLTYIHPAAFDPLTSLLHVDFYNNPKLINSVDPPVLPSTIIQLGLGYNRIFQSLPTKMLQNLQLLKRLNLTGNLFFILTSGALSTDLFPNLDALILQGCSISIINETAFKNLTHLAYLYLGGNQLTEIAPGAFPPSLLVLSIRQNPQVNSLFTFTLSKDNLVGMPLLYWLDMNLMKLDTRNLSAGVFNGLNQLTILQMRETGISSVPRLFSSLGQLLMLDIGQNELITSLPHDFFFGLNNTLMVFIDNCQLDFPQEFDGNYHPFSWMPNLMGLYLSANSINQFTPNLLAGLKQLYALDLSRNLLRTWQPGTTASMTSAAIDVSNNLISFLPNQTYEEFSRLAAIDLSDNSLTCNCQTLDLQLLANFSNTTVLNWEVLNAYQCTDFSTEPPVLKFIQKMTEEEFHCEEKVNPPDEGNDNTLTIVSSVVGAMIIVILLTATIGVCYVKRYKGNHRNWFYFRDDLFGHHKADENENEYEYDAFISFCENDRPWVYTHLVPKLEPPKDSADYDVNPSFRLCLHDRDFVVGQQITENIIEKVAKSRKVVIVLSRSFVESKWCQFELHLSQHRLLETERRDALVLIVLEDVPKQKQNAGLRYLMSTRTYLAWRSDTEGQRLFWQRLYQVLSHRDSPPAKTSS